MRRINDSLRTLAVVATLAVAPMFSEAADIVKYVHLDAIGNVRAITDQNGIVVERHDYLPFGEECTTGACASNPGVGAGEPRKFTGKERDTETGLDYFGARYYGSKIARFTTVDPVLDEQAALVNPQRWNRYAYVSNNPLRYVDPDGREQAVIVGGNTYMGGVDGRSAGSEQARDQAFNVLVTTVSLVATAGTGFAAGGARQAAREVAIEIFENVTGLPTVTISRSRSPRAARHIDDAQAAGHPDVITLDRSRARPNRKESLKGTQPQKGMDRDEYPPACCAEGGAGASVRPIPKGDNRSAGGQLGQQIKGIPDGARVRIRTKD